MTSYPARRGRDRGPRHLIELLAGSGRDGDVSVKVEAVFMRLEAPKGGESEGLAVAQLAGALVEDAVAVELAHTEEKLGVRIVVLVEACRVGRRIERLSPRGSSGEPARELLDGASEFGSVEVGPGAGLPGRGGGKASRERLRKTAARRWDAVLADNTFSFQRTRYEAPRDLRSRKNQIRFRRKRPDVVVAFFKGERMGRARPVDFLANDRKPRAAAAATEAMASHEARRASGESGRRWSYGEAKAEFIEVFYNQQQ